MRRSCDAARYVSASVTPIEELRRSATAALFQGGDEIPVSIFVTDYPERGQGPDLHYHPYAEAFVVQSGVATFTAGDERLDVAAGPGRGLPAPTGPRLQNPREGPPRGV